MISHLRYQAFILMNLDNPITPDPPMAFKYAFSIYGNTHFSKPKSGKVAKVCWAQNTTVFAFSGCK